MSNDSADKMQSQFEHTVVGPARTYASLVLDHFEQLASLQIETAQAYAETGLQQARAALEVRDPSDLQNYIENQRKIAKELGERVEENVEKVTSLNQRFAKNAQKVTEDSVREASDAAEENTREATQAAEETTRKATQSEDNGSRKENQASQKGSKKESQSNAKSQ